MTKFIDNSLSLGGLTKIGIVVMLGMIALTGTVIKPLRAEIVTDFATINLVSGVTATGDMSEIPLGLSVKLAPDWKIYWRSPGDAGLPPELTLIEINGRAPKPGQALDMAFPVPKRFNLFNLESFGYGQEVIFPVTLTGHEPGTPVNLLAHLEALICSDICIPVAGDFRVKLLEGVPHASPHAQDIARFSARVPSHITGPDILVESAQLEPNLSALIVTLGEGSPPINDIFVETDIKSISFLAPKNLANNRYHLAINGSFDKADLVSSRVRLTLRGDSQFTEVTVPVMAASSSSSLPSPSSILGLFRSFMPILWIMLVAVGGGLILNIMPCVLPVLSLKLTSIMSLSGQTKKIVRLRLLVGALGIITGFGLLGGMLVLLKIFGIQLGWGIQFQNPYFLAVMSFLMMLFTLTLLDVITLPIPKIAAGGKHKGLLGDFSSGFMATILATPCSAPLIGTAISFALAAPVGQLMLVMICMGLGLALPWLLLALFPSLILALPKPGPWLARVKPVLAIGLLLTLIWILWLFLSRSGIVASLFLIVSLLVTGGLLARPLGRGGLVGLISLIAFGVFVPASFSIGLGDKFIPKETVSLASWQKWSPARLAEARENNRIIFVDITADWCISCQFNKQFVLNNSAIIEAFEDYDILQLQGDWSSPDQQIADYLLEFGRFGIPFNALYFPGREEPVIFSELLSVGEIINALETTR